MDTISKKNEAGIHHAETKFFLAQPKFDFGTFLWSINLIIAKNSPHEVSIIINNAIEKLKNEGESKVFILGTLIMVKTQLQSKSNLMNDKINQLSDELFSKPIDQLFAEIADHKKYSKKIKLLLSFLNLGNQFFKD